MWLDFAEDQSKRRQQVFLKDWKSKLDDFLRFNDREVLETTGSLSKNEADSRASEEYEIFAQRRRDFLEAEGVRDTIKAIEDAAKERPKSE